MSRRTAREMALHVIFAISFTENDADNTLDEYLSEEFLRSLSLEYENFSDKIPVSQLSYLKEAVKGIELHLAELDSYIEKYTKGWNFGRISRISVCVMRISMYEMLYMPDIPRSASINEAVELAKIYDSPEAASFINGVLGTFYREELPK
ncbi:MAG: transcription antitermination factor NusB [Bacillota bacterium]|nr:transcription antitermination factor NusB [Bacillota bacterium]